MRKRIEQGMTLEQVQAARPAPAFRAKREGHGISYLQPHAVGS